METEQIINFNKIKSIGMIKSPPSNERVKLHYFEFLRKANGEVEKMITRFHDC